MAEKRKSDKPEAKDANRDPLTGEPGAHPVGAGAGAAVGGGVGGAALGAGAAAVAGAAGVGGALGTAAGPIGTVVGAVAGGIAGALAGKSIAESIDPTAEDAYWRENYPNRPYYDKGATYDEYQPAYRYGWESRSRYADRDYPEVESDLESGWNRARAKSRLGWEKARHAVRDAWDRVSGPREDRPLPKKG